MCFLLVICDYGNTNYSVLKRGKFYTDIFTIYFSQRGRQVF